MTVRRCGIQLPSGKSCPTFLSTEQNVCRAHAFDAQMARVRQQAPTLDPLTNIQHGLDYATSRCKKTRLRDRIITKLLARI